MTDNAVAISRRRFLGLPAWAVAVSAVIGAVFLWEIRVSLPTTVDDAYITYTFSKNVAQGHGPLYGHGVVVEGYSNFLWMLIVALGLVFRPDANPVVVARVFTVPFVLLMAVATYRLCRERASRLWSLAVVALLLVNSDVVTAFQFGLETVPYAALLTLAFWLYVRSLHTPGLRRWVVPAFVVAALMRIDGFLPLGYILVFEAVRRVWHRMHPARAEPRRDLRKVPREDLQAYLLWALPAVSLYLLWFGWRWHFYGLPLPSTYYAKAMIPKVLPNRGWEYVRDESLASGAFLVLPFAAVLLLRRSVGALALVLYVMGHVLYVVRVGGDWMPYGRFLLPVLPLTLVIAVWGGRALVVEVVARASKLSAVPSAILCALLFFMALRTERHLLGSELQRRKLAIAASQIPHIAMLTEAASLLNLAMPPGARLVTDYGGVFAYYTDAAPIEMWGLCNATIATRGGLQGVQPIYGKTCPECYPELHPEFFHVMGPITRDLQAFKSHQEVVNGVWQTDTIGRYLDFRADFIAGRVMIPARNRAVYFLERRRPQSQYRPRVINAEVLVDYPFEPGGRSPGL